MFQQHVDEKPGFLPSLTQAFISLDADGKGLQTLPFAEACGNVLPIFDHIGAVFMIAKHEFGGKRDTIVAVADQFPSLKDIVEAGKKDGTIVKKNSPSRNLHRLMNTLDFICHIFQNLAAGKALKDAVSDAYDSTLSNLHTWVVRAGIKTGMLGLPSREQFFKSIGETEDSAREHSEGFVDATKKLLADLGTLYVGVTIPKSDFSVSSLWS